MTDPINPSHYKATGYECIETSEGLPFNLGNAFKYQFRAGSKIHPGEDEVGSAIIDLEKCQWYLKREVDRVQRRIESLKSLKAQSPTSEDSSTPKTEPISSPGLGSIGDGRADVWSQVVRRLNKERRLSARASTNATSDPRNP